MTENPWPLDNWLLDGQQRWDAIISYVAGEFPVCNHLFPNLARRFQLKFKNQGFPCLTCRLGTAEECRHAYERLAYGGTAHRKKTEKEIK